MDARILFKVSITVFLLSGLLSMVWAPLAYVSIGAILFAFLSLIWNEI